MKALITVDMNVNILEIKGRKQVADSDEDQNTRLESIITTFVDNIIKAALEEIKNSLPVMEINEKVSSLRLSPGKRRHQDFLDEGRLSTPFVIFSDTTSKEFAHAENAIKTPIQKVVDFADPERRHIWDKENYDPNTKQYSTDRKKKKVKRLSDKEGNRCYRVPLEDITKKSQVGIDSNFFSGPSTQFIIKRSPKTSPKKNNGRKSDTSTKSVSLLRMR